MKNGMPSIKAEIDYLNKNEYEIYYVGDWVQKCIGRKERTGSLYESVAMQFCFIRDRS
jgi:hypothetical protein